MWKPPQVLHAVHPYSSLKTERKSFFDKLLVRIHLIIEMIWWTGLALWEFGFPWPPRCLLRCRRARFRATPLALHLYSFIVIGSLLIRPEPNLIKAGHPLTLIKAGHLVTKFISIECESPPVPQVVQPNKVPRDAPRPIRS